jgi:hypothetical protein
MSEANVNFGQVEMKSGGQTIMLANHITKPPLTGLD